LFPGAELGRIEGGQSGMLWRGRRQLEQSFDVFDVGTFTLRADLSSLKLVLTAIVPAATNVSNP
jgi:hypothetical protein